MIHPNDVTANVVNTRYTVLHGGQVMCELTMMNTSIVRGYSIHSVETGVAEREAYKAAFQRATEFEAYVRQQHQWEVALGVLGKPFYSFSPEFVCPVHDEPEAA